MESVNASDVSKTVAILAQGLITGSAYYISVVEVPARMSMDIKTAIRTWKPSFHKAKNSQVVLSVFSMAGEVPAYYLDYGTERQCVLWPIASGLATSIIPYTLFGMMGLNYQLPETNKCLEKGDGWIRDNLIKWANLHCVRTFINISAFGLMAYAGFMYRK